MHIGVSVILYTCLKKCGIFDRVSAGEDGASDGEETGRQFFLNEVIGVLWIANQKLGYPYRSIAYLQTAPQMRPKRSAAPKRGL